MSGKVEYTTKIKGTITDSGGVTMDFDESNVEYLVISDPPKKRHFVITEIDDS